MGHLADTNCLLRWAQPQHPLYPTARAAVQELRRRGEEIFVVAQNLIEFWNVATRPANCNGFGLTPAEADRELTRLEVSLPWPLTAQPSHPAWRRLVTTIWSLRGAGSRCATGCRYGGPRPLTHPHVQCHRFSPLPWHHRRPPAGPDSRSLNGLRAGGRSRRGRAGGNDLPCPRLAASWRLAQVYRGITLPTAPGRR